MAFRWPWQKTEVVVEPPPEPKKLRSYSVMNSQGIVYTVQAHTVKCSSDAAKSPWISFRREGHPQAVAVFENYIHCIEIIEKEKNSGPE